MGISKLKIPKICEYCGKQFEAKTVVTQLMTKQKNSLQTMMLLKRAEYFRMS